MGQYTEEEFETAFGQFQNTSKPLIFTYFKDAEISIGSANKKDLKGLWAFQEKLADLGHFYTLYKNIEELKFKFDQQLDKLLELAAWQIGNRVLALWSADGYWYTGTIMDSSRKRFLIHYDDGIKKWLTAENIIALDYGVGDPVECRWKRRELYYPARIVAIEGDGITVQYHYDSSPDGPSSGEKEQTNITLLRFSN